MPKFSFQHTILGPFALQFQNQYFNGWPTLGASPDRIVMAFPVEGTDAAAAVTVSQPSADRIEGEVHGTQTEQTAQKAWQQALAALSLDVDGSAWPEVGQRDGNLDKLQQHYNYMRPSLFHSPYEAAAGFVVGHRISIAQARKLRERIAEKHGYKIVVEGTTFHAFPTPRQLLAIGEIGLVNPTKSARLLAIAQAALDGWLDRQHLRQLPEDSALALLNTLPGIGPFFAQGILQRGAGTTDGMTLDDMTLGAIAASYPHLGEKPTIADAVALAEAWRPYRMWATVLLHVWMRQNNLVPKLRERR
jgi:DNA-3-methyladenine glycosylase II